MRRMLAIAMTAGFLGVPAWAADDEQKMIELLQLSNDQKAKFEQLHQGHNPAMRDVRQEIANQQQALKKLFTDAKASPDQVKRALEAWAALKGKKALLEALHMFDMHQLLSPSQRERFIEAHF